MTQIDVASKVSTAVETEEMIPPALMKLCRFCQEDGSNTYPLQPSFAEAQQVRNDVKVTFHNYSTPKLHYIVEAEGIYSSCC